VAVAVNKQTNLQNGRRAPRNASCDKSLSLLWGITAKNSNQKRSSFAATENHLSVQLLGISGPLLVQVNVIPLENVTLCRKPR
jgi:hypothetical protein